MHEGEGGDVHESTLQGIGSWHRQADRHARVNYNSNNLLGISKIHENGVATIATATTTTTTTITE